MNKFKKILAWFDWSNYASSVEYELPKTKLSLIFRFLLGIILLPLIWPLHIINIFFKPNYNGYQSFDKNESLFSSIYMVIILYYGLNVVDIIEPYINYNIIEITDSYILLYFKIFGLGLISLFLSITLITIFGFFVKYLIHKPLSYIKMGNFYRRVKIGEYNRIDW